MSIPDYGSRVKFDLLRFMPPNARVVLEVGCGKEVLVEAFRRINPDGWYQFQGSPRLLEQVFSLRI